MADSIELKRDHAHPSLAGTGTLYACAQVRLVEATKVRYQIAGAEWSYSLTPDIAQWLAKQPAPWGSQAGTNAKYTPCLIRPEDATNQQMRVQVPGTEFNRPWGAEFIHNGPCSPTALAVITAATTDKALGTPDEAEPDDQDLVDETTPEADVEEDEDDEEDDEPEDDDPAGPSDKAPF